jgi:predicted flap endonuclease-1-like 5' DNA nuclease
MAAAEPAIETEFPRQVGKVAQRALAVHGITTFAQLTEVTPAELLKIHGVGRKGVAILAEELAARGMSFAERDVDVESR